MKRIIMIVFTVATTFTAYAQTYFYLQAGDDCFDNGNYVCASIKYDEAFKSLSGKDKQIAEIKLTRAKWCADHINKANQAFKNKNYTAAKENYQNVLDSNPKDKYAQSQLEKCHTALNPSPRLRKATAADLADIWNNKYGMTPDRRQNLINAGIDPDDAQARINKGEGKPVTSATPPQHTGTTLTVSPENITISANGDRTIIYVTTNAGDYQIRYLPSWCKVGAKDGFWFSLVCDANTGAERKDWFRIVAGDKDMRINISQAGFVSTDNNKYKATPKRRKCFNCPQTKYSWGLTAGYVNKIMDFSLNEDGIIHDEIDGFQLGIRYEPLFKYGFGLDMGVFCEYYYKPNVHHYGENYEYEYDYVEYVLNIPFHLEYRFNFSKYFNLFAYGGVGLDLITDRFDNFTTHTLLEYGGGLRIDCVQFNIGQSVILKKFDGEFFHDINRNKYKNLIVSASYMF